MRLNEKVLMTLAVRGENSEVTKTGFLTIRDKDQGPGKQRWVVLRGNLLFYFRSKQRTLQDVVGCIVLERMVLTVTDSKNFEFKIEFESSKQPDYYFRAENQPDFDHWLEVLHTASHEYNSALLQILRQRKKGDSVPLLLQEYQVGSKEQESAAHDYRKLLEPLPPVDATQSGNTVSLRISISASGLVSPSFVVSSTYVQVQIKYLTWVNYHRTEVRRSTNPVYSQPAVFNFDYSLADKVKSTQLRIIVYHDSGVNATKKEAVEAPSLSEFAPFGVAECSIHDITDAQSDENGNSCLEIKLMDNERSSSFAGLLKLAVKDLVPMGETRSPRISNPKNTVVKLGKLVEGPIFRFGTVDDQGHMSGEVRAREYLGESAFFRIVPSRLLEIYTKEDTAAIRDLRDLAAVLGERHWDQLVRPSFEHLLQRQANYYKQASSLDGYLGCTFRPSVDKKKKEFEMTALNCHIQRFEVIDSENNTLGAYDTITHGAPAAHALKFKHGGLRRILKEFKEVEVYHQDAEMLQQHLTQMQSMIDSSALKLITTLSEAAEASINSADGGEGGKVTLSADDNKEIDRIIGETEFFSSLVGQNQLIEQAMADTVQLRNAQTRTWSVTDTPSSQGTNRKTSLFEAEIVNNKLSDLPNMNLNGSDKPVRHMSDVVRPVVERKQRYASVKNPPTVAPIKNNVLTSSLSRIPNQRRQASWDVENKPTRTQMEADLALCSSKLSMVSELEVVEIINILNNLRRTAKEAITEIGHALLIAELLKRGENLDTVVYRRDVAFSQACTILVTGFVSSLNAHSKDLLFLQQLSQIGYLAQFESLLSTQGDEMGMIEDMAQAVLDLRNVTFKLECAVSQTQVFEIIMFSGRRYEICIEIAVHAALFNRLPPELREGKKIDVNTIFLTQGVNEMQTLANKIGETELQDEIIAENYQDLVKYTTKYKTEICPLMNDQSAANRLKSDLDQCIVKLDKAIKSKKAKNLDILLIAQKITRKLKGGRLTCCKSGKDRTGMSVTLEQCNLLIEHHNMDPGTLQDALNLMRSIGTRMDNVEKNIGERKYAFNKLQIFALPKLLRPPLMAIGGAVT
eukprot:m.158306 g.158306  ORF g.158306 m.158306 type:complete len:1082 (+) comp31083_c0_seq1:68-3313(+)